MSKTRSRWQARSEKMPPTKTSPLIHLRRPPAALAGLIAVCREAPLAAGLDLNIELAVDNIHHRQTATGQCTKQKLISKWLFNMFLHHPGEWAGTIFLVIPTLAKPV
jgi:hypothetical protein